MIQGLLAGKPQSLKFADVSVDRRGGLAYSFRYFQDYDEVGAIAADVRADSRRRGAVRRQGLQLMGSGRRSCGRLRVCRSRPRRTARHPRKNPMFKRKASKDIQIDTLIGAKTRIHGDVDFAGGLHSMATSTAM